MQARRRIGNVVLAMALAILVAASLPAVAQRAVSAADCPEVTEKRTEIGCYTLTHQQLGRLPETPLFWHLHQYPTRRAAKIARGSHSTVVEAFQRTWLLTIAERGWQPPGGQRIAEIRPLPLPPAADFTAMYAEATFVPGGSVAPHRHFGPEVWYTLTGEQCLETPTGKGGRARTREHHHSGRLTNGSPSARNPNSSRALPNSSRLLPTSLDVHRRLDPERTMRK